MYTVQGLNDIRMIAHDTEPTSYSGDVKFIGYVDLTQGQ